MAKPWGPSQKVTIDQAILASTYNGAYSTFEEGIKGFDHGRASSLTMRSLPTTSTQWMWKRSKT